MTRPAALRLVLRLGHRLATRHRGRTVLLCLAVALPVGLSTAVAAVNATAGLGPAEAARLAFGAADGRVVTAAAADSPAADWRDPAAAEARLRALLPPGTGLAADLDVLGLAVGAPDGRRAEADGRVLDLADPLTDGVYRVDAGAPRDAAGTVVLSTALADRLGVRVGAQVSLGAAPERWTVTALAADRRDLTRDFFLLPPAAAGSPAGAAAVAAARTVGSPRWFVRLPAGAGAASVEARLAGHGYAYLPRASAARLAEGPPALDLAALLVGLGLLAEAVLLVAAALAVVVRTQRRNLGLLAVLGATPRLRGAIFVVHGLWVGAAGVLLGAAAGLLAARALVPPLQRRAAQDWGAFDPAPATLALVCAVTLAAVGVAAALVVRPARGDLTGLLRATADGPPRGRRGAAAAATLLVGAAVGVAVVAGARGDAGLALGGLAALVLGVTGSAAAGTVAAARAARRAYLPVGAALRGAARALLAFPGRATATAAALGLVLAVAAAALVLTASAAHKQRAGYRPALPTGAALLAVPRPLEPAELRRVAAAAATPAASPRGAPASGTASPGAAAAEPAGFQLAAVRVPGGEAPLVPLTDLLRCVQARGLLGTGAANDWSGCPDGGLRTEFPAVGVADAAAVERLTGRRLAAADRDAYDRRGVAVVTRPGVRDRASRAVTLVHLARGADGLTLAPVGAPVPAVLLPSTAEYGALPVVYVSPRTARARGLVGGDSRYLLPPAAGAPLDPQRLRRALPVDLQADAAVDVETGPSLAGLLPRLLGVVGLSALATTVLIVAAMCALWAADLRRDHQMLGAVGAPVAWRRRCGGALAGLLTGAGVLT
ncbi:MAG TPA: FtsX-like permease family protein, partial [Pilimelia sp.]|nr:FtsX-like permease family protein [Pilimelia sp.]